MFSADDSSDSFWSPEPADFPSSFMDAIFTRNHSDWPIEALLGLEDHAAPSPISTANAATSPETAVLYSASKFDGVKNVNAQCNRDRDENNSNSSLSHKCDNPIESLEYQKNILKNKLDLACAAIALSRAAVKKSETPTHSGEKGGLLESRGYGSSDAQNDPDAEACAIPSTTSKQSSGAILRQATSVSSGEDADDDELELDTETTENMDPSDCRRARRMLSNRESARRSRRRKQEQVNDLEVQVGELRVEHSALLRHLTEVNHKYREAAVNNRILKADIETLRTKVKMVEETVKRLKGMNPLLSRSTVQSSIGIPFVNRPLQASTSMPLQQNTNQFYHHSIPLETAQQNQNLQNSFAGSMTFFPSHVGSLDEAGTRNAVETSKLQCSAWLDCVQDQTGIRVVDNQVRCRADLGQ